MLIYLGGYHNSVRRELLELIHRQLPDARYLHFGDIDAGGFEIYEDLCAKTGIPFQQYYMSLQILKEYERYGKRLTVNDRKRVKDMRRKRSGVYDDVLDYMLERNVKLEQECIDRELQERKAKSTEIL